MTKSKTTDMRAYQFLTILLFFSLPFFPRQYVDASTQSLIVPLIVFFDICLLPIFFRALLNDIKRRFIPSFLFLVFLIPLTIATIFSIDKEQSVVQLRLFLSYFIMFVSIRSIFSTFKSKELLASCYLLLATCLSLISLYNTVVRHLVSRKDISFLWIYFGHNHLSSLLVFAIPLCLYFILTHWKNNKISPLILAAFSLLITSLLFTFSIGGMFSLAISFLIALLLFRKTISFKNFPLKKMYFMVFLIIAFLGISSFYWFSETKGIKTIKLRKDPLLYANARFIYWQRAFDNSLKNPLTGSGLDTFHKVTSNQTPPFSRYTHNFFIQILTDTGIFGFIASIALIVSILWQGAKRAFENGNFLYISLFTGLLSSVFLATIDLDWHLPTVFLFFWIFASLLNNYAN